MSFPELERLLLFLLIFLKRYVAFADKCAGSAKFRIVRLLRPLQSQFPSPGSSESEAGRDPLFQLLDA